MSILASKAGKNKTFFGGLIMWLSKDERNLLLGYFYLLEFLNSGTQFSGWDLIPLLSQPKKNWKQVKQSLNTGINAGNSTEMRPPEEAVRIYKENLEKVSRIDTTNHFLSERKLIKLTLHQSAVFYYTVSFTLEGYDLAKRYSNWFDSTELWFEAHKDHWIWLITSFVGGIIGALIINAFS